MKLKLIVILLALPLIPAAVAYCAPTKVPERVLVGNGCYPIPSGAFEGTHDAAMKQNPAGVTIHLSLAGSQSEFHPGERIPIRIEVSATASGCAFDCDNVERVGVSVWDDVYFEENPGASDPAPDYYSDRRNPLAFVITGPPAPIERLTPKPKSLTGDLNQWLRFAGPGVYHAYLTAQVLTGTGDRPFGFLLPQGARTYNVASDVLTIHIIPADPAWSSATLAKAQRQLDDRTLTYTADQPDTVGARTLRYMGTQDALRVLIRQFGDEALRDSGDWTVDKQATDALAEAIDRPAAYSEILRCIADPHFPVDDSTIDAAAMLKKLIDKTPSLLPGEPAFGNQWWAGREPIIAAASGAVDSKVGKAQAITAYTLFSESRFIIEAQLPDVKSKRSRYMTMVLNDFDSLPDSEVNELLFTWGAAWPDLAKRNVAPILRRVIHSTGESSDVRSEAAADLLQISPADGRAAIIADIASPSPTFSLSTLSLLPDRTLPSLDRRLAHNLVASQDPNSYELECGLIQRYATRAILRKVKRSVGASVDNLNASVLAYYLRVDPRYGDRQFRRYVRNERGKGAYVQIFTDVGRLYPCALVARVAEDELSDNDDTVRVNAINYLGLYANDDALLRRMLLKHNANLPASVKTAQLGLQVREFSLGGIGCALVSAITQNPNRLYLKSQLEPLAAHCVTTNEMGAYEEVVGSSECPPSLSLYFDGEVGWRFGQYYGMSFAAVQTLVAQFPEGCRVSIGYDGPTACQFASQADRLRNILARRGDTATVVGK